MAGREPEEDVALPVARFGWRSLTFLHWRVDEAALRPLIPEALEPDLVDGSAWVGLTPFLMTDFRPPLLPPVPKLSTFPETNLRTYVRGPDGRDGLWFLTLEVASAATTLGARALYGVPYHWADMTVEEDAGVVRYVSRRRSPDRTDVGHRIVVRPGTGLKPTQVSERDHLLTGRWRAWSEMAGGKLASTPVQHEPWPLCTAEVVDLEETLFTGVGLPPPTDDPVVHYSPGVDVRIGPPRPV